MGYHPWANNDPHLEMSFTKELCLDGYRGTEHKRVEIALPVSFRDLAAGGIIFGGGLNDWGRQVRKLYIGTCFTPEENISGHNRAVRHH
jgi:hypothetical protein